MAEGVMTRKKENTMRNCDTAALREVQGWGQAQVYKKTDFISTSAQSMACKMLRL